MTPGSAMAVVYTALSLIPVVVGILLSVSGSVSGLTPDLLTCLLSCFLFSGCTCSVRRSQWTSLIPLLWWHPAMTPPAQIWGTVTSLGEQNPTCTTTTLWYCSPSLLWLFLGGISEQQTYLYFWRQWMLAKLVVLLEIAFLTILGTVQPTESLMYFLSICFVFTLFWGSHGVRLWIWEEIKGEKRKGVKTKREWMWERGTFRAACLVLRGKRNFLLWSAKTAGVRRKSH